MCEIFRVMYYRLMLPRENFLNADTWNQAGRTGIIKKKIKTGKRESLKGEGK